jgi:glycosyltransferase involved in cell wall biosynthesis
VTIVTDDSISSEKLAELGFTVHKTRFRRKSPGLFAELANLFHIAGIIRKAKPAIVHNVALKAVVVGTLATRLVSNAQIVNAVTGLGISFALQPDEFRFKRVLLIQVMRLLLKGRRCHTIVQNPDDLRFLTSNRIIRPENAHLIFGSGVDPEEYCMVRGRPPVNNPRVVLAARLLWSKGVREFVEAADRLADACPAAEFLIAGKVDSANPDHIPQATLETFSEKPNVTWTGFIDDMVGFLSDATIVVLPSYREGVPKVLIEAAMIGLPIVTTDVPGCREAVIDGETGLLVPVNDAIALAEGIKTLLDDKALRSRFAYAAREFAKKKFSLESVLDETERVYARVLAAIH